MRGQMERMGFSYDWRRQMFAHRPEYYKFDQWFFLKMYEMGLAYKRMTQVNWCSHDQATLSNEQASGGICWRCGNPVTKKDLEQWFLKTTAYTNQLLDGLAEIESGWPASVIKRQSDWMGRSEGAFVDFEVKATDDSLFYCPIVDGLTSSSAIGKGRIRVFTTRIDTIFGANAIVLAAEHPVIQANLDNFAEPVSKKIAHIRVENTRPTDHEIEIEKDGIDTGLKAINPFSDEELPVWVGNYVMMEYGTGAVMSVPAHDERDFEFARKFGLAIKQVVVSAAATGAASIPACQPPAEATPEEPASQAGMLAAPVDAAFSDYGVLINSGDWSGKTSEVAKKEMAAYAESRRFGEAATTYRLRDWGISRQRFWGSPIPIVYCDTCGIVPERYENLPIRLPDDIPITGTGESPLAKVADFVDARCPKCGGPARRETDTMDTFVDSSWYFFRYLDPSNDEMPFDPEKAAYWTPVDQYIGGDDHAVMHLIYARFWTKVMRDMGLVKFDEPFKRLLTQGMVVGETFFDDTTGKKLYHMPGTVTVTRDAKGKIAGAVSADGRSLKYGIERMSKSKGNGVDPDEMVEIYGADAARLFVLFAAPIENELVWNEAGIEGAVRFLQRLWRLVLKWRPALSVPPAAAAGTDSARRLRRKTHQTIKRVADNFDELQFNTPVAALMELSNAISDFEIEPDNASEDEVAAIREAITALTLMLTPYAPHTSEELFSVLIGNENGILANGALFPEYNEDLAKADEIEIPVQINGKLRSRVMAAPETPNGELEKMAFADEKVREYTDGKEIVKVIVVPKRLVNIVVR